jgi:hypothetical protein
MQLLCAAASSFNNSNCLAKEAADFVYLDASSKDWKSCALMFLEAQGSNE